MEQKTIISDDGEIHRFFALSYAQYLVLPRTVLQSMPLEWQEKFVNMVEEIGEKFPDYQPIDTTYHVQLRDDKTGLFIDDPIADYERGRRRL